MALPETGAPAEGAVRSGDAEAVQVARLRAGDEQAFTSLVRALHPTLCRLARTIVRSEALVDEVVQEAWLGVVQGLGRFEGRASLKSWVVRILINRARTRSVREARGVPFSALSDSEAAPDSDFLPDGAWREAPAPWADTPERHLGNAQTRRILEAALADLPEGQRAVLELRDLGELDAQEVCALLGISEANQRVLLHRARVRVRAAFVAAWRAPSP